MTHPSHVLVDGRCAQCGAAPGWPVAATACPMRHDVQAGKLGRARKAASLRRLRVRRREERQAARYCDGCGDGEGPWVAVGEAPGCDTATATLCARCLRAAAALLPEGA